jgi:hypothetical protein
MSKRVISMVGLLALMALLTGVLTAAAPLPVTTFTLVSGLPSTMNVGETYTVVVQVESDQPFLFAQALPSFQYVGKGVVAVQGGDHAGRGTSATLEIIFQAKSPTTKIPNGIAPVHAVVGVRYPGGYVAVQDYLFNVTVP